eukprot:TRINITY_DN1305_c0_g1_i1.p2 TRINITY_DN1305_c0_g1~~TRINITY_DN1305_c0_g1_i1.p2  ORF type:complete len:1388 (+),score=391.80 TRINITY_DN1305_c0_g1_i1:4484-8647(+)
MVPKVFTLPKEEKLIKDFPCSFIQGDKTVFGKFVVAEDHLIFFVDIHKPLQERIIKEGYLFKSSRETYWRKLYVFVESDAIIFCKKPEHRYNPKSIINWCDIHSVEKVGPEITKKNFSFSITTTRKTWYLFAANESDRDEWIEAMRSKIGTPTDQSNVMAIIPLRTVEFIHTVNSYMYSNGFQVNTRDGQEFYFSSISQDVDTLKEEILKLRDESLKKPQPEDKEEEEDMPPADEESSTAGMDTKDINSTENTIFHKRFQLPESEVLIESYSCSLVRMISHSGRMYVSQNYVCFYSNIFGVKNIVVIPFRDVIQIKKQNSLFLFPNSILIKTKDESFFFNTFLYRHNAFTLLKKCLHLAEQKRGSSSPKLSDYAKVIQEDSIDEMMSTDQNLRFTFMIVGSRGDVQPVIALALRLETYGHKCKIATHEAHRKFVEENGLAFYPLAGDPKDLMALCVKNDMFSISFFKEALSKFTHFMADLLVTCWDACKTDTDVILENPACMAGPSIAEKLGIPLIEMFTIPWTRTTQFPNPFAVSSAASPIYNYSSFVAMEQGMYQPMRGILNKFRSQVLGLPFLGITDYRIHSDRHIPFIYCWSPSVLPKPHDWPEYIDVTGYWFMEPDKNYKPDPKLVQWLKNGPKPIYIGFGSVTVEDPDGLTKTIFEAVKMSGARAVLSKGWGGMGADNYPDYIFPVDNVPHDWLFPFCAGTIQHGGAGTTAAALRAGIPTMIVPFFGDQFFWAKRIETLGVGPTHMSIKNINTEKLSKSINTLLTDREMIQRAASLGEQIRSQDGVGRAVAAINRSISHYQKRTEKPEDKKKSPLMRITIDNRTPNYLRRIKWRMDRGSWGTLPPENIAPGSSETIHVQADSSYLFTGLEGWVVYCTKSISSPPHAPKSLLKRTRSDRIIPLDEKNAPVKPKFGTKGPKPKPVVATPAVESTERPSLTGSGSKSILKRSRSYSVGDVPTTFNNINQNNTEVNANNVNLNNGLKMDEEGEVIHVKNVTFAPEELAKGLKENNSVVREPKRMNFRALAKSSPANLLVAEKNNSVSLINMKERCGFYFTKTAFGLRTKYYHQATPAFRVEQDRDNDGITFRVYYDEQGHLEQQRSRRSKVDKRSLEKVTRHKINKHKKTHVDDVALEGLKSSQVEAIEKHNMIAESWRHKINKAYKSVEVTIMNDTPFDLKRSDTVLKHGFWGRIPPEKIATGADISFGTGSNSRLSGTEAYVSYEVSWTEEDGTQVSDILTLFWNNPILSSAKFNYHCTKLSVLVDFDSKRHAKVIFGIFKKGEAPELQKTEELRDILNMRRSLGADSEESGQNGIEASNDEYFSTHENDDEDGTEGDRHEDEVPEDSLTEKFYSASEDQASGGELTANGIIKKPATPAINSA